MVSSFSLVKTPSSVWVELPDCEGISSFPKGVGLPDEGDPLV
jgi:hypothetical protein